jgi:hypothetical protein
MTLTGGHFDNLGVPPFPVGVIPNHLSSSIAGSQGDLTIDTVRVGFNHTFN